MAGTLTAPKPKRGQGAQLRATQSMAARAENILGEYADLATRKPSQLVHRTKSDRWQQIAQDVVEAAELAISHVLRSLRDKVAGNIDGEGMRSLRDATTVFAILADKGRVLEDLLMHLDGRVSGANVQELTRKTHELLAVTQELERRGRAVDVTPPAPDPAD